MELPSPRRRRESMSRILIVDDDGETCRFMAELLGAPGSRRCGRRSTSREALTLARQPFDLLISDINLDAQQNGMDVLRAFKQGNPQRARRAHQRLRDAADRDRRRARRRVRLHQQAVQHLRSEGHRGTRAHRCRDAAAPNVRRSMSRRRADRPHGRHAVGLQADRARGKRGRAGADHRRQRNRQGAGRASDPRARPAGTARRLSRSTAAH